MDLNLISKQIQFMPDAQLAQSVKNPSGVMPSYLALAELNRRQKLRASAPQQEPQGTVADEVLQSLHSAGMQPQAPMQQGAPMPQQQGIAQAQPQAPGMRSGGLVQAFADGGEVEDGEDEDDDSDLQQAPAPAPVNAGIAAGSNPAFGTPAAPSIPAYNPKQVSYGDAASAMRAAYGPGQDYTEELQGIKKLRNNLHQPSDRDLSRLQGLYTMASKDPMGGLAEASLAAHKDWDGQNQQYYKDMMENYGSTFKLKNTMDERNDKIADSIRDYWKASNLFGIQMANGEQKAAYDSARVAETHLKNAHDALKTDLPTAFNIREKARQVMNDPNASEQDKSQAGAAFKAADGVITGVQDQEKQKQDARRNQALDVAKIGAHARVAAANANKEGLNLSPEAIKQLAVAYHVKGPEVLSNLGQGAAIGGIKTQIINLSAQMFGGEGKDAFTMDSVNTKTDVKSLDKITTTLDALEGFERAAGKNLDQFMNLTANLPDTGLPWLNTPVRALAKNAVGDEWMPAVEAAKNVGLREIARVTNNPSLSGVLSDSARKEVEDLVPDKATLPQIKHVVEVLRSDMKNVRESTTQQKGMIQDRIKVRARPSANDKANGDTSSPATAPASQTPKAGHPLIDPKNDPLGLGK